MRVEYDLKLGFKDVMFRPKRSALSSRSHVNLHREFKLLNSKSTWKGIPLMAANMDSVGTFEMALALFKLDIFTAIHKHYTVVEWEKFLKDAPVGIENFIAVSTGITEKDLKKVADIFSLFSQREDTLVHPFGVFFVPEANQLVRFY